MSSFDFVTYPCVAHALPFRTILGEYRVRREMDLAAAVAKHILQLEKAPADLRPVWSALDKALSDSEESYEALAAMKEVLSTIRQEPGEKDEDFRARMAVGYQETLNTEKACQVCDRPLKQILHEMQATAVCVSGGGIRSASFSLGVLEGLARFSRPSGWTPNRKNLMDSLDYISTVSGGGYIGSWLMAWAYRSRYQQVVSQLAASAPTSGDPEPQPIRHLREYTSYLSPNYGFTLDTLTLGAIVVRNMILNWLTLIPVMICLLCLPEFLWELSYGLPFAAQKDTDWYQPVMALAVLCVTIASAFAAVRMSWPPYASQFKDPQKQGSTDLELWLFAVPLMLGTWLLGEAWAWAAINRIFTGTSASATIVPLAKWLFVFAVLPPTSISIFRLRILIGSDGKARPTAFHRHDGSGRIAWRRVIWSLVAPMAAAGLAAGLLSICVFYLSGHLIIANADHFLVTRRFVMLIVPLVWGVLMVASTLLSGLLSNIEREEEREWWARAGGLLFACVLAWVVFNGVAYFAADTLKFVSASILAVVGIGTGYLGSLAGLSMATASGLKRVKVEQLSKWQQWLSRHDALAPVASGIALVCITFALAALTSWIRRGLYMLMRNDLRSGAEGSLHHFLTAGLGLHSGPLLVVTERLKIDAIATLVVFLVAAVLAVVGNLFINVNTFSLHGMYRMRLTRAYLGASNFARHPDSFTNFDPEDNLYETAMPRSQDAPLHVINTALNTVATKNLAWQQRKAESFTFSPVSCGSWRLGYVPTDVYGGSRGVRLGTAMAISGAALSPNMGYNSSPFVTLLMTFFNARLGWWLPNPVWPALKNWDPKKKRAQKFLRKNGPTLALVPLVDEALGNTNDTYKWIGLSDGGHFENLGLYEMVLRRCHSIIAIDADADSDLQFEDLGNAIRKIEIDLGIPITFSDYPKGFALKKGIDDANVYCMEGQIGYDCVDEGAKKGKLLFVKPVLTGGEPPDICSYYSSHPDFPHESTANQFFDEAQFESYRHLGSWAIWMVAERSGTPGAGCDMEAFISKVKAYREAGTRSTPV
ncbi:MAG: patatin-like phospholipase family protein [Acidobacteriota bacterium]|nr:patatin-like phospholipase family protein [Acidobacteriota bacterium]